MRHAIAVLASLLLAASATAEDDATWAARPAVRIGDRVLTRADLGRRLLHSFGLGLVRGRILHEQLEQALAAKKLAVEPSAVEVERKEVLADLEARGMTLDALLRTSRRTIEDFDRDVWNLAAGEILASKVGIREAELPGYLALNFPARDSGDPDDPILMRIGRKEIPLRPLVEALLPLVDATARNRFLSGIVALEAVELALAGKIAEPTDADLKLLEDEARARILKASQGRQTLEMVLRSQKQSLAAYRRSLQRGERIRRAILAETTEDALRQHFDRWRIFFEGQRVRVSHLLVRCPEGSPVATETEARQKIEALRERIEDGEEFAKVALEASDDAGSRLRGGDLGFIPRKSPLIAEAFAAAAFALEKGALAGPIRTRAGFHLVLAADRQPGQAVTFEEARKDVEKDYAESRSLEWIAERRKGLTPEILWDELKVRVEPGEPDAGE